MGFILSEVDETLKDLREGMVPDWHLGFLWHHCGEWTECRDNAGPPPCSGSLGRKGWVSDESSFLRDGETWMGTRSPGLIWK